MSTKITVPAGVVKQRVPRPLTDEEKERVSLEGLVRRFGKDHDQKKPVEVIVSKDNNGWKQQS